MLSLAKTLALLALASSATPAHADVLEIAGGQTRWIAGPLVPAPAIAAQAMTLAEPGTTATWVPEQADASPAEYLRAVPLGYAAKVAELSARYDLSPALIEAVVWQESRWHAEAVSPVGARGLAQLMPGTARQMGVDPNDPMANLEGGARYLRAQIDHFGGDIEKGLAAYNAGPGRVESAGGVPAIRETQNYVASVMGRLSNQMQRVP